MTPEEFVNRLWATRDHDRAFEIDRFQDDGEVTTTVTISGGGLVVEFCPNDVDVIDIDIEDIVNIEWNIDDDPDFRIPSLIADSIGRFPFFYRTARWKGVLASWAIEIELESGIEIISQGTKSLEPLISTLKLGLVLERVRLPSELFTDPGRLIDK